MNQFYASLHNETEALQDRSIRLRFPEECSILIFLEQGSMVIAHQDEEETLEGPALCFWPPKQYPPLRLIAGARALILGLSDDITFDAIGARSESVHLRMLVENHFAVNLDASPLSSQIKTMLEWFSEELETSVVQSPMTLSALLRLIFIGALRLLNPQSMQAGAETTTILRRFRHLVELHYRDRWQVSQYANDLEIDYDRLNRICKRETGLSPAELVYERLTAEAKARLEYSGHPLKKIAADLGFSDTTRFSHFFKRRTNMSPGAYRAIVSHTDGEDIIKLKRGFADWP